MQAATDGTRSAAAARWESGRLETAAELGPQYSAKRWEQGLRGYCAAQVATTEQTDIDTEYYQLRTGPPSTSRLRVAVIVGVKFGS